MPNHKKSGLARLLTAAAAVLLLLGLASLGSRFLLGYHSSLAATVAVGQPDTLLEWYLAVVWAAAALFSAALARSDGRPNRFFWILLALLCLTASQEAMIGAFERLVLPARFLWPVFYNVTWLKLAIALSFFALVWGFVSRQRPETTRLMVMAMALYILSLVIQLLSVYALDWLPTRLLAHVLYSALEAALRLAVASLVVYVLWQEVCERYSLVRIHESSTSLD